MLLQRNGTVVHNEAGSRRRLLPGNSTTKSTFRKEKRIMKKQKKQIGWALVLAVFFLGIIAGPSPLAAAEKCKKTTYVTIGDGVAASLGMAIAGKWAELITKNIPCVSASATPGGFVGNALATQEKRITIGIADPNTLYNTVNGLVKQAKGRETKDLRYVTYSGFGCFQIFTPKNSPIKSVREAVTKYPLRNLMVVSKLAGHYQWIGEIFKAYGTSYADLEKRGGSLAFVSYASAINLMKDGQCDMLMIHTTAPTSTILDIDSHPGVRFLEIEPEMREKIIKQIPGMVPVTVPAGTYKNMTEEYHTFGVYFHQFVHKDLPDDLVYQATKTYWDNVDQFRQIGPFIKNIKIENAMTGVNIPVHPGAAKYYKEKGVAVPDIKMP